MEILFINSNLSKAAKKAAKIDIPKQTKGSKTAAIKFCSNKKNNKSKGRKKLRDVNSTNITTRLVENTLIQSTDSIPKSLKTKAVNLSNNHEKSVLSSYTNELLSKYENENRPVLSSIEKKILTQKAISSARVDIRERENPHELYSASPEILSNSYRNSSDYPLKAQYFYPKSDVTEP